MNENKVIFAVAGFMFVAGLGFSAQADPAAGGCPPTDLYELIKVKKAIDVHKATLTDQDGNNDNYVCEKVGGFTYKDNDL